MKIHLTPHHLRLTEAIEQQTVAKLSSLDEINDHVIAAYVVLAQDQTGDPDARFSVSARLAVGGPDLHAEERGNDLYAAIDAVTAKLARQLRKRKTKLTDRRRVKLQRALESEKRTG